MKIALIIPTYNERENIGNLLGQLLEVTKPLKRHQFFFVVVDDNSPDGTKDVVLKYQKRYSTIYLITGRKDGLGKALLRGMAYAANILHCDYIAQMDADLSHDPKSFPAFVAALDQGSDFVVGSRYIPGGSIPGNWAMYRKIYSVVGNAIVRFGLGFPRVHDWTGGYRAYKRTYYERAKEQLTKHRGYVFQIAFLHKALLAEATVTEVPIHFTDRKFGHSKIAPSEYIRDVFSYVIASRMQTLFRGKFMKFCIVGTVGLIINTIVLELVVKLGYHPALGSAFGAEAAIVSNFMFNNAWTFRSHKIVGLKRLKKFFQFNITSVGAIIIQAGIVWMGSKIVGLSSYRLFYFFGVGIGLVWNYVMYSRIIWKKSSVSHNKDLFVK